MMKIAARWICVAAIALTYGCAAGTAHNQSSTTGQSADAAATQGTASAATGDKGISGVWEGTSIADCSGVRISDMGRCEAMENITFTMFQQGSDISGYYKCAFGTQECRDLAETGVIKNATMMGRRLMMRVMLDDGSMCYFTGIPAGDFLEGRYSCMTSGLYESGRFRTQRSY